MDKIETSLVEKAASYVTELLEKELSPDLVYHIPGHTKGVVEAAEEIGKKSGLNADQINLVLFCAWFHDVGYLKTYHEHEDESAKAAGLFLKEAGASDALIKRVRGIIMATQVPQTPNDIVSSVLCDADLKHLSKVNYYDYAELMRQEMKTVGQRKISKLDFDIQSVEFFNSHSYHTEYGKTVLQKGKEKNLELIKKNIIKRQEKMKKAMKLQNEELKNIQQKPDKKKGYSRGVESMFRLTARNQINLSSIADNKSNILISVNTIIISILLSVLVSRFSEYPNIILPTLVFLMFSLITIIFAILSTRPNISSGTFTKEDIKRKNVNLLFFGSFYNMKLEEYEWALEEMMKDDDYLYGNMIKDQYFLGKVLAKKYKLLRIAYNFFMFGLIISVVTFVLAFTSL